MYIKCKQTFEIFIFPFILVHFHSSCFSSSPVFPHLLFFLISCFSSLPLSPHLLFLLSSCKPNCQVLHHWYRSCFLLEFVSWSTWGIAICRCCCWIYRFYTFLSFFLYFLYSFLKNRHWSWGHHQTSFLHVWCWGQGIHPWGIVSITKTKHKIK